MSEALTDDEFRARRSSDKLLTALRRQHGETHQVVKIEIKPVKESTRVHDLEEQLEEYKFVIARQKEIIAGLCDQKELARPRISEILEAVCSFYNLSRLSVTGQTRKPKITLARQIVFYLARELTEHSTSEIGRKLSRDHTTVLYGAEKIENLLLVDLKLRADVDFLKLRIEAKLETRRALAERALS